MAAIAGWAPATQTAIAAIAAAPVDSAAARIRRVRRTGVEPIMEVMSFLHLIDSPLGTSDAAGRIGRRSNIFS
jgi:hypothetical protein